ncbi:hypothetical protein [Arthrobacter rhizosphaerae]|uniref:hypothetical protein n=1 Tax=Arthrobacter rhizosphaerae TaxID=2855490 RepID=UPI001FF6C960|nr:hypothetical protein [Arthrobacter rhizosphaerae]
MKNPSRLVPAVVGMLIAGLTACAASAETPEPTPTAVASKAFSESELAKLVMFGPRDGEKFTVVTSQQIRKARDKTRAAMSQWESEPSDCADMPITSVLDLPENAVITAATNGTPTTAGTLSISLLPELDAAGLEQALHAKAALMERCPKVVIGSGAGPIHTTGKHVTVPTRTPGSVAVQSSVDFPTGEKKTTVFITAVKGGVVLSVQTTGSTLSEADLRAAAEILDRVADHIE